jgi:hypothetical protein
MTLKRSIFWDITPCNPLEVNRRFGEIYCLHFQRWRINRTRHQHESRWQEVSCSAYSSILKMEAIYSSETSIDFQRTTWRYIPEDSIVHNHRCENLKSYDYYSSSLFSWDSYFFRAYGYHWPVTPNPSLCSRFRCLWLASFLFSLIKTATRPTFINLKTEVYVSPKRWNQPDSTVSRPTREQPRPYRCSRRAQARDLLGESARESRSDAVRLAHAQSL